MIRVAFESAEKSVINAAEAEPFARLIDVCDESHAPVEFSCRSGTCGTCRIEVLEGADLLREPSTDEVETLLAFDAPPTHRLACRARFRVAEGLLRVRFAGDDP